MDATEISKEKKQANARLALLGIAPVGSIVFALFSLLGNDLWRVLLLGFSGFLGTISLITGVITLVFQIARNRLNIRNAIAFGFLYIAAVFAYVGGCVSFVATVGD